MNVAWLINNAKEGQPTHPPFLMELLFLDQVVKMREVEPNLCVAKQAKQANQPVFSFLFMIYLDIVSRYSTHRQKKIKIVIIRQGN